MNNSRARGEYNKNSPGVTSTSLPANVLSVGLYMPGAQASIWARAKVYAPRLMALLAPSFDTMMALRFSLS